MGTKRNYSITKDKYRFNDDYALGNNEIAAKYLTTNFIASGVLTSSNDWCFCVFINPVADPIASFPRIYDNKLSLVDGIDFRLQRVSTKYKIQVSLGYFPNNNITFAQLIEFNQWKSICVNYDSTTKDLSLYVDSRLSETINTGGFVFATDGLFANVMDYHVPGTTINTSYKGQIRSLAIFNRQSATSEINYYYSTETIHKDLIENDNCEFYLPLNHIPYLNGGVPYMLDMVNSVRKTPKSPNHGEMIGWSFDELGLNVGTSTFNAYADFYTKNLGENFSGGLDSIIYKTKELRKYGIRLDGTQYFSILNLNQFDINKGLTILVGIADINLVGSSKEFIHLTDSNSNRVITLKYDDISSNVNFRSGDTVQDTQSVEIDKTASNFAVYRISADQNKYSNGLFTKSSGINAVDTTRLNTTLNRTDATYNVYLGSGNAGATPLDCVITYFAMFEGVLNDAEVKPYFNNGIFSNVADLSQTTKSTLIVAADFNNPVDDLGVLKIPDLSANNETIIATGFANITALESVKEEILSLI